MTPRSRLAALLFTIAAMSCGALPSRAESGSGLQDVAALHLSAELAAWAREQRDARAMLLAAEILARTPHVILGDDPTRGATMLSHMLAEARSFGGGDPAIDAAIAQIRAVEPKGLQYGGAGIVVDTVAGNAVNSYRLRFKGGQVAVVMLLGTGGLELVVTDERGNRLCANAGRRPECVWAPRWTGDFILHVRNPAKQANSYQLTAN